MAAQNWLSQGTLVLASNNKGKIAEFEKMFTELDLPVEVIPQGKLNIEDAIEDGLSFIEMRLLKRVMQAEFQVNLLLQMTLVFAYPF